MVPHNVLFIPVAMEISGRLSAEAQDLVAMLTTFSDGRSATTPTAIGEGKANKIVERLTRVVMKWNAYKFAYARKRYNQVQHQVMRYTNSNIILSNSFPA